MPKQNSDIQKLVVDTDYNKFDRHDLQKNLNTFLKDKKKTIKEVAEDIKAEDQRRKEEIENKRNKKKSKEKDKDDSEEGDEKEEKKDKKDEIPTLESQLKEVIDTFYEANKEAPLSYLEKK